MTRADTSQSSAGIPKLMSHIWIGPKPAPIEWMQTWQEKHPDWDYRIYDNDYLERTSFKTQRLIDFYLDVAMYAGVADLMRYEILFEHGGYLAPADCICLHPIDELLNGAKAHTVYENEMIRGKLVSPILACEPGNEFVGQLIDRLCTVTADELVHPWISTGNLFVAKMIEELQPDIEILPSHTMIPVHHTGIVYEGADKVYAMQTFGSTRSAYGKEKKHKRLSFAERRAKKERQKRIDAFNDRCVNRRTGVFQEVNRWMPQG
ncbi:hypothetical protein ROA7450_01225 [Roseovarius albus]|uniref:Glycosyltransferase sugar-binding region containing DXD motif protein n=1 Tax=Roseovarius albus TaxID=1247867 RepID=A0A1X6YRK5_9RHOB|nr:glycosyltransferase [Roseovarius albus]SLN29017.1 hypothetical protein ROA7450_01225 [Roseovarius albus]